MGREKLKMKKIDDISARQVTFSKRRGGLFKKAHELSILCGAEVAGIVYSPAGKLHQYASSNIKDILHKYSLHLDSPVGIKGENKTCAQINRGIEDMINQLKRIKGECLQQMGAEELRRIESKLESVLGYVGERKRKLLANEVPALQTKDTQNVDTTRAESGKIRHPAQDVPDPIISELNQEKDCLQYFYGSKRLAAQAGSGVTDNYPEHWIPPSTGVYKVNFCGTNFQDMNVSGVGVVIRNCRGEFMAALARIFPGTMDENTTSSMAAKCALEFAADYYFTHIVLEGDAHSIIKGLNNNTSQTLSPSSIAILLEAKDCMKQLDTCICSHVNKSGNIAACMVAHYARNLRDEHVWLMKEPDFLGETLMADVLRLNF